MLRKILIGLFVVLLVLVIAFVTFVQLSWNKKYDFPYPDLQTSADSAIIEKGRYLVTGPAHCISCHVASIDDMIKADGNVDVPLKGGVSFPLGPLGTIRPANLTPDPRTGIGRYQDGEVFRMMRHAVKPDGTATLALMMPFWDMADEDLVAVVSYLRSMEPVEHGVPDNKWTFMGKAVRALAPTFKPVKDPSPPKEAPPMAPTVERGEYLARFVGNCVGCHTARDPMTFEAIGPEFAGGMEFEPWPEFHDAIGVDPDLWTKSPNITPHPNSALTKFKTVDEWLTRFRQGRVIMHSPMDWGPFSRMTDEDLEALWLFLNSLEPIENDVVEVTFKKN